jgi:hypothetical protein
MRLVEVGLGEIISSEKLRTFWNGLIYCLGKGLSGLILTKKLFVYKKHSYTKPVAGNVLMVPVTWTDFLAILNGIATKGHSRAESIAVGYLIGCQPLLNLKNYLWFRKEFVRAPSCVSL